MTSHQPYQTITHYKVSLTIPDDETTEVIIKTKSAGVCFASVCEKHKINESDLIRRSIATFVENLNQTPDHQSKYLFV